MAYIPNRRFTIGDFDTIQAMAMRGCTVGQIAGPLSARMKHRGEPHYEVTASDVLRLCDMNGIFVRTKGVAS